MAIHETLKDRWGKPLKVEAVFFDVGGTLVRGGLTHLDLLHQALVTIGYKVNRDEVVRANHLARGAVARCRRRLAARMDCSQASRMWLDHLADALRLDLQGADLEQELAWAIRDIETRGEETVDPDARPLLEHLQHRGLMLGVISNWSADLPQYLTKRGLAKYFHAIIASDAVGASKPHREIFLRGLTALGCAADRAVHVGDDYWTDVVGARGLGIHPVLLDRDQEAVQADCPTIIQLKELEGLL